MQISSADIQKVTDGLVTAVAQKASLTEEQSRRAVLAAFEYLQENLPPEVAKDVGTFAKGGGDVNTAIEWFLKQIGRK